MTSGYALRIEPSLSPVPVMSKKHSCRHTCTHCNFRTSRKWHLVRHENTKSPHQMCNEACLQNAIYKKPNIRSETPDSYQAMQQSQPTSTIPSGASGSQTQTRNGRSHPGSKYSRNKSARTQDEDDANGSLSEPEEYDPSIRASSSLRSEPPLATRHTRARPAANPDESGSEYCESDDEDYTDIEEIPPIQARLRRSARTSSRSRQYARPSYVESDVDTEGESDTDIVDELDVYTEGELDVDAPEWASELELEDGVDYYGNFALYARARDAGNLEGFTANEDDRSVIDPLPHFRARVAPEPFKMGLSVAKAPPVPPEAPGKGLDVALSNSPTPPRQIVPRVSR